MREMCAENRRLLVQTTLMHPPSAVFLARFISLDPRNSCRGATRNAYWKVLVPAGQAPTRIVGSTAFSEQPENVEETLVGHGQFPSSRNPGAHDGYGIYRGALIAVWHRLLTTFRKPTPFERSLNEFRSSLDHALRTLIRASRRAARSSRRTARSSACKRSRNCLQRSGRSSEQWDQAWRRNA